MSSRAYLDCCICLDTLVENSKMKLKHISCCGTLMCKSCKELLDLENAKARSRFKCPICRASAPTSNEEIFARYMKHANEGRAWALNKVGECYRERNKGVDISFEKAFE